MPPSERRRMLTKKEEAEEQEKSGLGALRTHAPALRASFLYETLGPTG